MHRLTIILALASAGCIAGTTSDDDAKAASVASALTDNLLFEGGTIIDSALPETTDDAVTITPLDTTVIVSPGTSSILSLEVIHIEEEADPITATLVQFAGEGRHIQVTARMKAPDAQGRVRVDNPFEVGSDVCEKLCNTTHFSTVTETTLLESGTVGAVTTFTMELDCNESGDAAFCSGTDSVVEGRPMSSEPAQDASVGGTDGEAILTAAQLQRFIDQQRDISLVECSCDGTCDGAIPAAEESALQALQDCLGAMDIPDAGWLDCRLDVADEELACETEAMCDTIALDDCRNTIDGEATCGVVPPEIDDALTACGFVTGDQTAPMDGWKCDDGTVIDPSWVCDQARDCPDGSDEVSCGGVALGPQFSCMDPGGTLVSVSLMCDGLPDCPGGEDEVPCQAGSFLCQELAETIPVDWVCDGVADCQDASDELPCGGGGGV